VPPEFNIDSTVSFSKLPFFGGMSMAHLAQVRQACSEVDYEAGKTVFTAGDQPEAFYIVLSGRLQVWSGGNQVDLIGEIGPGELFGERALILDEPRSATIRAVEDSRLLVITRDAFEKYIVTNPQTRTHLEGVRRLRRVDTISKQPPFSFVDPDELLGLEKHLEERSYDRGEVVFSIGDPGDALYFVLSGEFEVRLGEGEGQVVGFLGPPNSFGESAMLLNEPRSATIKATTRSRLLILKRGPFEHFFLDNKKALEYFDEVRENHGIHTLERVPLLQYLSPEELATVRGLFSEVVYKKGDVVCRAGEEGDTFYVVRSGQLEVRGGEKNELLGRIGPSGFFGEESLILDEPRRATVTAVQDARLLMLEKSHFERFFLKNPKAITYLNEVRRRRRAAAVGQIHLFDLVRPEEIAAIENEFVESTFRKGETVCHAGDESNTFYIVLSGQLEVWSATDPPVRLARLGAGDFFGEVAVMLGEKRSATVIADQRSRLLGLPKQSFAKLFKHNSRALEHFSKVVTQRLAATVGGEKASEGTVPIVVIGRPGLKGKSLVAGALAKQLSHLTKANVLLVRMERGAERDDSPHLHLSNFDRTIDTVRRKLLESGIRPPALTMEFDSDRSSEQHGTRLSAFVTRLSTDFRYIVFDLASEPPSLSTSSREFADVVVEIVEQAEPQFAPDPERDNSGRSTGLRRYPVVNLYNPVSRRMPISTCLPFVLPNDPGVGAESVFTNPRSPAAVPLWRLARKILGQSVGLALGGGAAFGLSHLGVLKVLEENEIPIDMVVGCSIGSMVAVSYAAGFRVDDMISRTTSMGSTKYVATGLDFTLSRPGLMGGDSLRSRFTPLLGDHKTFEDLLLPCRTVATDIESGELVSIGRGTLEDAYRASIGVPLVLAPTVLDGRVLVDGGVADPVPAETARHMGADLCIGVPVVPPMKKGVITQISKWTNRLNLMNPFAYLSGTKDMPNSFDITMNSLQTLQHELGRYKVMSADVSIAPELSDFTWTDFDRAAELIDRGVEAAEAALPDLQRMLRPRE
jgi:NTE family protein